MGVNILVGVDRDSVLHASKILAEKEVFFTEGSYGKGSAGRTILRLVLAVS